MPLLAGLAVARALREQAEVDAVLKWPNDVLVGGRKVCGVLAEVPETGAVVLGIGLNVTTRADGAAPRPGHLAAARRRDDHRPGHAAAGRAAGARRGARGRRRSRAAYRRRCSTLGAAVRVELPGGTSVEGTAEAVDDDGRLVVDGTAYAAGDVVHLRPA